MADISKITLPSGTTYNIKDAEARSQIAALVGGDAVIFVGVSSTPLTDGGSQIPTVGGEQKTPATGQLFFYGTQEFIWGDDDTWHGLGTLDTLGDLAYKDTASVSYQPKGSISGGTFSGNSTTFTGKFIPNGTVGVPTISVDVAGATTTIKNPTSVTVAKTMVAVAPGMETPSNPVTYYAVSGETLSLYQLGYTTGDSITTSNINVKTGDATYVSSQPSWTGLQGNISVSGTPNGSNTTISFTGIEETITVE